MKPSSAIPTMNSTPQLASAIPESSFYQQDMNTPPVQPQQQPVQPHPQAAQGSQPTWWEKLLPTVGGIIGGLAGGAADVASLGLLTPLINPVTGAAAGGAFGQMGENAATNKPILQANDITSGLLNGVGELGGMGIVKGLGAVGGALTDWGSNMAAKTAASDASKALGQDSIDSTMATKLNFGGGNNEKLQTALQLGKNQKILDGLGYTSTDPYQMQAAARAGADFQNPTDLSLNNVYQDALTQSGTRDTSGIHSLLGATPVDQNALTQAEVKALGKQGISPQLAQDGTVIGGQPGASSTYQGIDGGSPVGQALGVYNKSKGLDPLTVLPGQMQATDVKALQSQIGKQLETQKQIVANAQVGGENNPQAIQSVSQLGNIYDKLGSTVNTPEVDQAIASRVTTPEERNALIAKFGATHGNQLADTIDKAQTSKDLLAPMQSYTQMSRLSKNAINNIENATGTVDALGRQKFAAAGNTTAKDTTGSATKGALDTGMGLLTKGGHPVAVAGAIANHIHGSGLTPKALEVTGNALAGAAKVGSSKVIPAVTTAAANIPDIAAMSQSAIPLSNQQQGSAMKPGAVSAPINPLQQAVSQALQTNSSPWAQYGPGYSSANSLLSTLAPQAEKQVLASNALNNLSPAYANAGGAQGPIGGLLDRIVGNLVPGSAQATFQNQSTAAAAQLAAALGIPIQAAQAMLESQMQTPGSAAISQGNQAGLMNNLTAQ